MLGPIGLFYQVIVALSVVIVIGLVAGWAGQLHWAWLAEKARTEAAVPLLRFSPEELKKAKAEVDPPELVDLFTPMPTIRPVRSSQAAIAAAWGPRDRSLGAISFFTQRGLSGYGIYGEGLTAQKVPMLALENQLGRMGRCRRRLFSITAVRAVATDGEKLIIYLWRGWAHQEPMLLFLLEKFAENGSLSLAWGDPEKAPQHYIFSLPESHEKRSG